MDTTKHPDEIDNIELRSDEVQDILSRPPKYMIRNGSLIIMFIIMILLSGSFFFRYPDIVSGPVVITGDQPPLWVIARTTGKIKEIYCNDRDSVHYRQLLAVLENTANTSDIIRTEKLLQTLNLQNNLISGIEHFNNFSPVLGDAQSAYNELITVLTEYDNFRLYNQHKLDVQTNRELLKHRKTYINEIKQQITLKKNELRLAKNELERDKNLYISNVISENDLEQTQKGYLRINEELKQLESTISFQTIETTGLSGSIIKSGNNFLQEQKKLTGSFITAKHMLQNELDKWYLNYALKASGNGTIDFNSFCKTGQDVKTGDKIFSIVQKQANNYLAKMQITANEYGKIQTKQKVNIKIEGYPFMEFGLLKGTVKHLPLVPTDGVYIIDIYLDQKLLSSIGKQIPFAGEITGTADIFTTDRSILERILSPVLYYLAN